MTYECLLRKFFLVNGDGCLWTTPPLQVELCLPFIPFEGLEIDAQKFVHPQKVAKVVWHNKSKKFHLDTEMSRISQSELCSTLAYHKIEGWTMFDNDKSSLMTIKKIDYDLLKV